MNRRDLLKAAAAALVPATPAVAVATDRKLTPTFQHDEFPAAATDYVVEVTRLTPSQELRWAIERVCYDDTSFDTVNRLFRDRFERYLYYFAFPEVTLLRPLSLRDFVAQFDPDRHGLVRVQTCRLVTEVDRVDPCPVDLALLDNPRSVSAYTGLYHPPAFSMVGGSAIDRIEAFLGWAAEAVAKKAEVLLPELGQQPVLLAEPLVVIKRETSMLVDVSVCCSLAVPLEPSAEKVPSFPTTRDEFCDAIKWFLVRHGREAEVVYVPPAMARVLETWTVNEWGGLRGKEDFALRRSETLFGCRIVWDADAFRLE